MNSPRYIITFILILTTIVAVLLTGLRQVTMGKAAQNEDIFNKRAILQAVETQFPEGQEVKDLSDQEVLEIFNEEMEQMVLDYNGNVIEGVKAEDIDMAKERKKPEEERRYPLYIYEGGGNPTYILSVRGNGLWDEIWGNVALDNDLNTIVGVAFDHKAETPGLGAEIKDNPAFSRQFIGKKIYEDDGDYVSVKVKKGGADDSNPHAVDGISGATITADGVTDMLYKWIKYYEPYLQTLKNDQGTQQGMLIK